jgi:hypothetical protein
MKNRNAWNLKFTYLLKHVDLVATAILSSALFFTFARFDPEPHHDGIQLASAIGVSEGLRIHSEVFSQYGAVVPWLNGLWLSITSQTLLSLRIFGAIQLVGISVLMQLIMSQIGLRRSTKNLATLSWLVTCPVWAYQKWFFSLWPWPSISYMSVSLLGVYVVVRIRGNQKSDSALWVFSGFLFGLAALIRPNYGVVFFGSLGLLLLIRSLRSISGRQVRLFVLGTASPAFGMLAALLLTQSIRGWFNQSILGPATGKAVAKIDFSYFYGIYFANWRQLAISFIVLILLFVFRTRLKLPAPIVFLIALGLGFKAFTQVDPINPSTWLPKNFVLDPLADPLSAMATIRLGLIIGVVCLLIIGVRFRYFTETLERDALDNRFVLSVLMAAALAGIAQLYPLPDVYHLWWASPPILIICALVLNQVDTRAINLVIAFFLPTAILSISRLDEQLNIRRIEWQGGVLAGMYVDSELSSSFRSAAVILAQIDPQTRFECRDGLWAVFDGNYNSDGPNFVGWAYGTRVADDSAEGSIVWCLDSGMTTDKNELKSRKLITSGDQSLFFSRFSGDIEIELWKK